MTGGGRCQRRKKGMAGGMGAAVPDNFDTNNNSRNPNLESEITEKPLGFREITKLPPPSNFEFDLFTQARKALSFRSPFDSEEVSASVSGSNSLPSGVSTLLRWGYDSRKRHKKLNLGLDGKVSKKTTGKQGSNVWVQTEEYFRELSVEDVERLYRFSSFRFSVDDKCFLIPCLSDDGDRCIRYCGINRLIASACEKDSLSLENGGKVGDDDGKVEVDETMVQEENGDCSMDMDVDGDNVETKELDKEESNGEKVLNVEKDSTSFSGVEWLLGSRSKIYLTTQRPSKKRKRLGRDAGLEKLLVARPVAGLDSVCHYCSYGGMADPLNCLIKCASCGVMVHQRCYGVQEDVDSSWLCSWCKWKNETGLSIETPCLLCSQQGGALKPVQKAKFESEGERSKVEFAHLFCCQWMPEVYLENTRTMEPIMDVDEIKDTRRKLICYLCKVKCGACVRCSNGSCRTSFHPICAREAGHRMEIWGKLGSDEVELRAFCSKHSEVQNDSGSLDVGDNSLTDDTDFSELNDGLDGETPTDKRRKTESQPENGDALHPADKHSASRNHNVDVNTHSDVNFTMILKKLIDLGKVNAKDVASEIGVPPDSLNNILTDNHMVPELQCKLLKWLKNHAHIGNLQNNLKVKIKSLTSSKAVEDVAQHLGAVSVEESSISGVVPVKSVPPRRRTKSNIQIVKDDNLCSSNIKSNGESNGDTTASDAALCLLGGEDPTGPSGESLPEVTNKIVVDSEQHQDNTTNDSIVTEDELTALAQCLSDDGLVGETKHSQQILAPSLVLKNENVHPTSYIHPCIYGRLMQTENDMLEKAVFNQFAGLGQRENSQLEASSSSGLCCNNQDAECNEVNLDQLAKARNLGMLNLSPADEVEGQLVYYQQSLLQNAVSRRHYSDDLVSKVVRSLPQEIDTAGKRKWDAVLVSQYNLDLKEAKKQGRKERRHKEAQVVLAAATAAAAASSRISSIRKDSPEEPSNQGLLKMNVSDARPGFHAHPNPRVRETISRSGARSSIDKNSDAFQLAPDFSKDHPRTCDICTRSETLLNPILVCLSCKVAVHLDCYRSVKSATGPWHCELCEELLSSRGSVSQPTNSWEKPYLVAECVLCGGTAGAFRKSVDGQWIHALCAEWVLESTYRRGQVGPIEGMDTVSMGIDACTVCHRKQGVCLKCSYGHCHSMFHPTCARSSGFYMMVRNTGGKLQRKAYCEKHSTEQRAKVETQKHGIEEFKSLKQVRVELERLRLLCERIIKREKLKRELVICSHDILARNRDSVLSTLARHPFYQPEVSSESATTSIRGHTDGNKSGSEKLQRSDDITVDSTVAGKRRVKISMSMDNDQKTDDSSTSQNHGTLKPPERTSLSGKQIPQRLSITSRNLSDDAEKLSKYRKPIETFEKEIKMTSDQASMRNQRLPKGFVYVPVVRLSKDKEAALDACPKEPVERKG